MTEHSSSSLSHTQELGVKPSLLSIFFIGFVALLVRLLFFDKTTPDFTAFLLPWFTEIREYGGFAAMGRSIGDYSPSYLYILAALTYLPVQALTAVKTVSTIGDFVIAVYVMRLVHLQTKSAQKAILAYALVLFLPTVVMNSSVWAQCDSLYCAALAASLFYLMREEPGKGMAAFGIAFAFKLQAIFFAPFVLILLLKRRIKWYQLFYVPLVYLVSILPAALAGRNFWELLLIYVNQTGTYSNELFMGAPNFYAYFRVENTLPIAAVGMLLFLVLLAGGTLYLARRNFALTHGTLLRLALLSVLFTPFVLPYMHERYFYMADVLSAVYAVCYPKRWFVPVLVVGASLCSYVLYLYFALPIPYFLAPLSMFAALCVVAKDTYDGIAKGPRGAKHPESQRASS